MLSSKQMTRFATHLTIVLATSVALTGCAKKVKTAKTAKPPKIGSTETGIASWYGHPYHGRRAANGEVYDMDKLTAAHRTYPFNTWVRVRNLTNDRTVDVRIQDRGPFIDGRIIDLSRAAAKEIELIGPGIAKVKLTVIAPPKDPDAQPELFALQVGAFRDHARALALQEQMRSRFGAARIVERGADPPMFRVLAGEFASETEAETAAAAVRDGGGEAFVVRLDEPAALAPPR